MKSVITLVWFLPVLACAQDLFIECAGKTKFIHRGAPSTVPAAETRRYRLLANQLDGLSCEQSKSQIACMGLTPQQAMRKLVIDPVLLSVTDTMELPTSLLIFEGQCQTLK
ncbi:MAG: hypothetical protein ACK5AJ_08265 [bacterium]|jgi:hypothetical protein